MPEPVTCPSGKVYQWTRPPRHIHWRHGRAGQVFQQKVEEIAAGIEESGEAVSDNEKGMRLLESMSEQETAGLERYINDLLRAGLGYDPTPERVPETDYWHLFGRAVYAVKEAKVETVEGDTTAAAVETFREKLGVPEAGAEVSDVRGVPVGQDGNS